MRVETLRAAARYPLPPGKGPVEGYVKSVWSRKGRSWVGEALALFSTEMGIKIGRKCRWQHRGTLELTS